MNTLTLTLSRRALARYMAPRIERILRTWNMGWVKGAFNRWKTHVHQELQVALLAEVGSNVVRTCKLRVRVHPKCETWQVTSLAKAEKQLVTSRSFHCWLQSHSSKLHRRLDTLLRALAASKMRASNSHAQVESWGLWHRHLEKRKRVMYQESSDRLQQMRDEAVRAREEIIVKHDVLRRHLVSVLEQRWSLGLEECFALWRQQHHARAASELKAALLRRSRRALPLAHQLLKSSPPYSFLPDLASPFL